MVAPIMKPKLLDPWTLARVSAPDKASTKFFFSKFQDFSFIQSSIIYYFELLIHINFYVFLDGQEPFTYTKSHTREFGAPGDESLSQRQREILER